jgi:hypothetical protein
VTNFITTQLTNGFGNNIFQYAAARLLGEYHKLPVYALAPTPDYYGIPDLKNLGVQFIDDAPQSTGATHQVNESNFIKTFDKSYNRHNIRLSGYFEDYRYYFNNLETIKSWFPAVATRDDNALVLHMRTGDRLFMKNEFHSKPRIENYLNAIKKFDFEELHIVTDMPKWSTVTEDELQSMKFHVNTPQSERVPIEESVRYFNELVEGLAAYSPQITQRSVGEDFEFIRSFKNILFEHGTLSWWAAVLSNAEKVGVYGPWRSWKGAQNKNLSKIPLNNWFRWE